MCRKDFPDEEGTKTSHPTKWSHENTKSRKDFPDEEGTKTIERGSKPAQRFQDRRKDFPDEEGTEHSTMIIDAAPPA